MNTYLRTWALDDIHISRSGDGRTVTAYAAVFDAPYEVRDQHGHYMESIERSAFNRTLSHGGAARAACLYNHGLTVHGTPDAKLSVPLGTPLEIKPDGRGLLTVTRYNRGEVADLVLESIRNGDIKSQSFRGRIFRSSPDRVPRAMRGGILPTVTRHELGLSDYGPTPVPVNAGAEILAVRSASQIVEELEHLDDDERDELFEELARHLRGRHSQSSHGNRFHTPGDRGSGLRRKGVSKLDSPDDDKRDDDDDERESTNPLDRERERQQREKADAEKATADKAASDAADTAEWQSVMDRVKANHGELADHGKARTAAAKQARREHGLPSAVEAKRLTNSRDPQERARGYAAESVTHAAAGLASAKTAHDNNRRQVEAADRALAGDMRPANREKLQAARDRVAALLPENRQHIAEAEGELDARVAEWKTSSADATSPSVQAADYRGPDETARSLSVDLFDIDDAPAPDEVLDVDTATPDNSGPGAEDSPTAGHSGRLSIRRNRIRAELISLGVIKP